MTTRPASKQAPAGWFSRRHKTPDAHERARAEGVRDPRSKREARQARAAERAAAYETLSLDEKLSRVGAREKVRLLRRLSMMKRGEA